MVRLKAFHPDGAVEYVIINCTIGAIPEAMLIHGMEIVPMSSM
jgi:hypothetical protein